MNFLHIYHSIESAPNSTQQPHHLPRRDLIKSSGVFAGEAAARLGFGQTAQAHYAEILTLYLEDWIKTPRAITGGIGRWGDVKGAVSEVAIEKNDSRLDLGVAQVPSPNIRFTFTTAPRR